MMYIKTTNGISPLVRDDVGTGTKYELSSTPNIPISADVTKVLLETSLSPGVYLIVANVHFGQISDRVSRYQIRLAGTGVTENSIILYTGASWYTEIPLVTYASSTSNINVQLKCACQVNTKARGFLNILQL